MSKEEVELKYINELIVEGNKTMEIISILERRLKKNNNKIKKQGKIKKTIRIIKKIERIIQKKILIYKSKFNQKDFSKINKISDLRVVSILDEFSFECFKPELNLLPISKDNYKQEIKTFKPHILFVESAWRGNYGQWAVARDLDEIIKLVYFCKSKGIITVFWNKEDPVHFRSFIKKAQHFDFIFTTDEGIVTEYKEKTKNENVFSLPFAVQPRLHNPTREFEVRQKKSVFAGTFYRNKYPERFESIVYMLYAAQKYGLDIYDRNYKLNNKFYEFLHIFEENIVGNLPYKNIKQAYKGYMVNLNVNTVTESETMFSRRVFEVLACNTPVVSNYSVGISKMFPNIVLLGNTIQEFEQHFDKLFNDHDYYKKISFLGVRAVLTNHTYRERVYTILEKIGININVDYKNVLIISKVNTKTEFNKVIKYFNDQIYKYKEVLIISDNIESDKYKILKTNEIEKIKTIIDNKSIDYVGLFNPNNFYGNNYISDLIMHEQYLLDCDGICKKSYYSMNDGVLSLKYPNNEYLFTEQFFWDRAIINKEKVKVLINYLLNSDDNEKIKCFSVDCYNFIENYNKLSKNKLEKIII